MMEANTAKALDSFGEKALQQISQQIQMLQTAFQNMSRLTQQDLENLRADMDRQFGRMTEASTARAPDSFREKDLQQISQQIQTQETAVQNMQGSTEEHLDILRADMERQLELFKMQRYKVDVSLDPDTAHPRLEISDNGKSVKDTGTIRTVPRNEKRFDSHLYVLAKEGYTSGRHYWEVDVGKRSSWALGIARESVTRKGTLTLSPKNGFWVMGCTDGREYWAFTEPWTRLSVGGKLPKIGIFLDISAKQLLFYNVCKKAALYTFTIADGSSREGKLLPFFSTGSAAAKADTEPLKIVQRFDDDE
ncbi:PREDICTED: zinc finger protein RFP-like [Calidris pugnax]|uniref:zinc finger protein RFP-like n=1 Tax=Calidris pugnax TaxID=198806 RepID=UPI00071C6E7D|nr:PREDICTED: zinc finger protein RFP-like [Calidris pugnax]